MLPSSAHEAAETNTGLYVPIDIGQRFSQNKSHQAPLLSSILKLDQAVASASLFLRRYTMKPTPQKPISIIAQVAGSGTAATVTLNGVLRSSLPLPKKP